jgi:hypothetical protein
VASRPATRRAAFIIDSTASGVRYCRVQLAWFGRRLSGRFSRGIRSSIVFIVRVLFVLWAFDVHFARAAADGTRTIQRGSHFDESKLVIAAAGAAQKAVDYILSWPLDTAQESVCALAADAESGLEIW